MDRRVLIVGTVPYNKQMTSRAFDSYFHYWKPENLAQIFSHPGEPVKGHCGTLYQITDKMMLKRRIKRGCSTGKVYDYGQLSDHSQPQTSGGGIIQTLYALGKKKFPLNYLLRGVLWKQKYWCTDELLSWADNFKPECIFLAFSDDFFIPRIALFFAERYHIPIVSCIGDDYYFNDRFSVSPFYHIYRKKYKKLIDRVFAHGGSAAYIGDKIRDKYNCHFGLDGETVYLTSEIERQPFRAIDIHHPKITYCGNIRLGRSESLAEIGRALVTVNPSYRLTVYSNESVPRYYQRLKTAEGISYCGTVPYETVKKVLSDSDVVVVAEGFAKKDVDITRYSLSTKVADSLASGRFVLGYGSQECGAIEYLKLTDCGLTCTSYHELKDGLNRLFGNVEYQLEKYNRSAKISRQNHSLENSTAVFASVVEKAIRNYGKK